MLNIAFLSSLRANLQISSGDDVYHSSVTNTPDALCPVAPIPNQPLPSPSPFFISRDGPDTPSIEPVSRSPSSSPHTTQTQVQTASTEDEKTEALRLIADSILQQRFIAVRSVFLHPIILCLALLVHAIVARWFLRRPRDTILVAFSYTVFILSVAFAMAYVTREYGEFAKQTATRTWLTQFHQARHPQSPSNNKAILEDDILVAKYDSKVVGVLVLRTARTHAFMAGAPSGPPRNHRRRSSHSSHARLTGIIRAWTVKTSYRRKGIGTDLLRQAVEVCRQRRLDGPVFADEHANAVRVLPRIFNADFERKQNMARELLMDVIEEEC